MNHWLMRDRDSFWRQIAREEKERLNPLRKQILWTLYIQKTGHIDRDFIAKNPDSPYAQIVNDIESGLDVWKK